MSGRLQEDAWHQAALPGDDHQEPQEVFHVRSAGTRRQERQATLQGQQLPEHDQSETLHLYHAHEVGRWLESDPVQPLGFHPQGLRHQLHRNPTSSDPLQLQNQKGLLLRQTLLRGRATCRVQTLPPCPEQEIVAATLHGF